MKTLFLVITRGLLVRNIMRTNVIKKLVDHGNIRIVVMFPNVLKKELPAYFIEEFKNDNIVLEVIPNATFRQGARIFNNFTSKLVFTRSTRIYTKYHINNEKRMSLIPYIFHSTFYTILSQFTFLKRIARWMSNKFFVSHAYESYFEKYKPDLVFSTSIMSGIDNEIMQEAQKRGVKTVAMPKSWDNLDKLFFRFEPDAFLVQNEVMRQEVVKLQAFHKENIHVVGFSQFDIYSDQSIILSKEEYCKKKNFDPSFPILFLGSEGEWSTGDTEVFRSIIQAKNEGKIPNCNILIRPHFSSVRHHEYGQFSKEQNVFIDDKYRLSDFFVDSWEPSREDNEDFVNSLFHCNIMISFASTLALDAVSFDKPIIGIRYGVRPIDGEFRADLLYKTCHYEWVLETKAIDIVDSPSELFQTIHNYLKNTHYKKNEREILRQKLCYKNDGNSSQRIVDVILSLLYEKK